MLVAFLLALPSLFVGFVGDDYFIRATVLQDKRVLPDDRMPRDAFTLIKKGSQNIRQGIEKGLYPWWTDPELCIAFFRPLSTLTHVIDFTLFQHSAWLMHLHSIFWYALLVLVAGLLYRRFLAPGWIAGLAVLLYAADHTHAVSVSLLNCRNALIAAVFGLLTLFAHDRWRAQGSGICMVIALVSFFLAVLSGESGVATAGYLLSYALFIDEAKPAARFSALLPYLIAGILWRGAYTALGYQAAHTGIYLDPGGDVLRFAGAFFLRLPVLLLSQLAVPCADVWALLPLNAALMYVGASLVFLLFAVWVFLPLLRADRRLCFLALGAVVSSVPFCAALPSNRFLFFTGFGCIGIIARLIATALDTSLWHAPLWNRPRKIFIYTLIMIHAIISAPLFAASTLLPLFIQRPLVLAEKTIRAPEDARVMVVNAPSDLMFLYLPFIRGAEGRPQSIKPFLLSSGMHPLEVKRTDERTLVIRFNRGMLDGLWNQFFRDPTVSPCARGFRMTRDWISITVTDADDRGPREIWYSLHVPLEDKSLKWVTWSDRGFVPFPLPAVGETVALKSLPLWWPLKALYQSYVMPEEGSG